MSESRDMVASNDSEDTIEQFGADLRALIRRTGMSEREVNRRTNTPPSTMSGYLNGKNLIPLATLRRVLIALDVTDADQALWIERWEAFNSAVKPATCKHAINLSEMIARSLGVEAGLPSGTKVKVTIEIEVP